MVSGEYIGVVGERERNTSGVVWLKTRGTSSCSLPSRAQLALMGVSDTEQGQDYEQVFLRRGVDEGAELLKSNMALLGVVQSKLEKERAVGSGMSLLGEAEAKKANDHEEGPSMGLMVEAEAEQKMGGGGVLCLCRTIRSAAWSLSSI